MSANDYQVGGTHYQGKEVQPWDALQSWLSHEAFCGFLTGNIVKYVSRWRQKGGVEDLRKAKHYIEKLIETTLGAPQSANPGPASIGPGTTADATLRAQRATWDARVKEQR